MDINNFIRELIKCFPFQNNNTLLSYSDFIEEKLHAYIELLEKVNDDGLIKIISSEFCKNPTKKRFINLEKCICNRCLDILSLIIKGDLYNAITQLNKLLQNNYSIQYKLNERLINYVRIKILKNPLYRIVEYSREENPQNCNHVPYEMREKANMDRFNMNGYPCLYLSDSIDGCKKELSNSNNKEKYSSSFTPKMNPQIVFFDLILPKQDYLESITDFDKFRFILTYPLYIMCLSINNTKFKYEYLFPQLLFHLLFFSEKNNNTYNIRGIAYSSTKDPKHTNYIIPAMMKNKLLYNGHSEYISDLFTEKFNGKLNCNINNHN